MELDQGMDDALVMDEHLNLAELDPEEPLDLKDLKALVGQGCGVDGNLAAICQVG